MGRAAGLTQTILLSRIGVQTIKMHPVFLGITIIRDLVKIRVGTGIVNNRLFPCSTIQHHHIVCHLDGGPLEQGQVQEKYIAMTLRSFRD
ncbi:MAG: hypothetical protein HUK40_14230 [Desulfobacter sp.]|nr:hypothetical protein [Desulfobacter sp.]WDP87704.1 MAG: hypothetical protein HUN05_23355 [Desulfobacter sp.]